jgi:hypothetical protein
MGTWVREFLVVISDLDVCHDYRMYIHDAWVFLHVGSASAWVEVSAV